MSISEDRSYCVRRKGTEGSYWYRHLPTGHLQWISPKPILQPECYLDRDAIVSILGMGMTGIIPREYSQTYAVVSF